MDELKKKVIAMPIERKPGFKCPKCGNSFYVKRVRFKSGTTMIRYRVCRVDRGGCGNEEITSEKILDRQKSDVVEYTTPESHPILHVQKNSMAYIP